MRRFARAAGRAQVSCKQAVATVLTTFLFLLFFAGNVSADAPASREAPRRPAVAAPNLSLGSRYQFSSFERTDTRIATPGSFAGIRIGDFDDHLVSGELNLTLPVTHSTGVRLRARGDYYQQRASLDLFGPGSESFSTESYGLGLDAFMRDPDLGAITLGVDLGSTDLGNTDNANEIAGRLRAEYFFPDLGGGLMTWSGEMFYRRVNFSGPGAIAEFDVDSFGIQGGAEWYVAEFAAVDVSVGWTRGENGFENSEDTYGSFGFSGLLGRTSVVSAEISAGASVGSREIKIAPFPDDRKMFYRLMVGLTLRINSGHSLAEIARAYD